MLEEINWNCDPLCFQTQAIVKRNLWLNIRLQSCFKNKLYTSKQNNQITNCVTIKKLTEHCHQCNKCIIQHTCTVVLRIFHQGDSNSVQLWSSAVASWHDQKVHCITAHTGTSPWYSLNQCVLPQDNPSVDVVLSRLYAVKE